MDWIRFRLFGFIHFLPTPWWTLFSSCCSPNQWLFDAEKRVSNYLPPPFFDTAPPLPPPSLPFYTVRHKQLKSRILSDLLDTQLDADSLHTHRQGWCSTFLLYLPSKKTRFKFICKLSNGWNVIHWKEKSVGRETPRLKLRMLLNWNVYGVPFINRRKKMFVKGRTCVYNKILNRKILGTCKRLESIFFLDLKKAKLKFWKELNLGCEMLEFQKSCRVYKCVVEFH